MHIRVIRGQKPMKRISIVLSILTSCCLAQQDPFGDGRGSGNHVERDPFGDPGPPRDPGPYVPPPNIRVFLQYIEVAHTDLTNLLEDGPSGAVLHTRAMALVDKRAARIVDSAVFTFQSGRRTSAESIREYIYPAEKEPDSFGWNSGSLSGSSFPGIPSLRLLASPWWISWDTRNTGLTFDFETPIIFSFDDPTINLRFLVEDVSFSGLIPWMERRDRWGDDSLRMPLFETRRVTQQLPLQDGVYELASVIDPLPRPPAPAQSTKVLVFVRCEVPG